MKRYVSFNADLFERLGNILCRLLHHEITRPVQGQYICLECLRRHAVNF
jgi:hypothetical protein